MGRVLRTLLVPVVAVATLLAAVLWLGTAPAGAEPRRPSAPAAAAAASDDPLPLPTVPLPDCRNGLGDEPGGLYDNRDCQGTVAYFNTGTYEDRAPRPDLDAFTLTASTNTLDFRTNADRGSDQIISLNVSIPQIPDKPDDSDPSFAVRTQVRFSWPDTVRGRIVGVRVAGRAMESSSELELSKVGDCGTFDEPTGRCDYRVDWEAYDSPNFQKRIDNDAVFRVGIEWDMLYHTVHNGEDIPNLDTLGGGRSYVAFRTTAPPPLKAVATAERLGPRQFAFHSDGSGPMIETISWSHFSNGNVGVDLHSNLPTYEVDFDEHPEVPSGRSSIMQLLVIDHYTRAQFAFAPFTLLQTTGTTQGALNITSFEVVSSANGIVKLKAVVTNATKDRVVNVGLVGARDPQGAVRTSPATVPNIDAGEAALFDVYVPTDQLASFLVKVQAFGLATTGNVSSAQATATVNGPPPAPGDTTSTKVGNAGDDRLEVASNDGFGIGDYAQIGSGADREIRRITGFGSLIFSAPLTKAHPVGTTVREVDPPGGDTTAPSITLTAPADGAVVAQGAAVPLTFTCSDTGVGVESCGGATPSGTPLDTGSPGAKQATITAWDTNGNLASRVVRYTVRSGTSSNFVAAAYEAFLGRPPSAAELDLHAVALDRASESRRQLVDGLSASPEWVERTVDGLYQDILGRAGDDGGRSYWTDEITSRHRSVAAVATYFYSSPEYYSGLGGGSDTTWVTDLYRAILDRQPDPGGLAFWVALAPHHRGDVARRIFQSRESRERRVAALYDELLHRAPDPDGLAYWQQQILSTGDLGLAAALASSDEFFANAQST
jgi:hypothetical protein